LPAYAYLDAHEHRDGEGDDGEQVGEHNQDLGACSEIITNYQLQYLQTNILININKYKNKTILII
jgi:hypothetical protein